MGFSSRLPEIPALQYIWGLGGVGGLLAVIDKTNSKTYLPTSDARGTIQSLIDAATGSVVAEFSYDPYGRQLCSTKSSSGIHMPFKFQSKYYDQEFGLYNFGLRFYDPSTCKWLNRDPIGESGGLNLYAYCDGDPINNWDYLGCTDWRPWKDDFFLWEAGQWTGSGMYWSGDLLVDATTTSVGGVKDLSLATATSPLVMVERGLGYRELDTVLPYTGKHFEAAFASFGRRWQFGRQAGLMESSLMLAQEIPTIGNFIPSSRGNNGAASAIIICGGINADSLRDSNIRDARTLGNLISNGVNPATPILFAPYDRGTATEVGLGMFFGYKARGLEWAEQVVNQIPENSTIYSYGHSGGVTRSSLGTNYIGIYNIGVAKQCSEQGPAIGFYNNIGNLSSNYSIGQDVTSDLGTILSPFYWAPSFRNNWSWSNDPHEQPGTGSGNEFNRIRGTFLRY